MHSTYSCDCDNLSCRRQFSLSPDSPTPIYTQNYLEEENSVSFRDCQAVSEVANHTIVCEGEEKEEESVKLDVGSKTAGSKEADTNEGSTGSKEADTNEGSKTAESKEVDTNEGSKTAESKEVDTKDPEPSGVKMWVRAPVMDDENEEVLLSDSTIRPKKLRVLEKREASGESESGEEKMDESEDKDVDEAERYKRLFSEKFRILTCDKNKTPNAAISEIYIEEIENFLR